MFLPSPEIDEMSELVKNSAKMFFASRFKFLQAINGIRPGCVHGLLAPTSMGKSTLLRSVIADTSEVAKVGILLSEEKPLEYSAGFISQKEPVCWDNVKFMSERELENNYQTKEQQIDAIISFALEQEIKVLFWDNITTGTILGDSVTPARMSGLLERLKTGLFENGIALFFVAHTSKAVKTEQGHIFSGEDVRGSNQYYMKSEYFFTLQLKTKGDEKIAFVTIAKHRFHQPNKRYYVLDFKVNRYERDIGVDYSKIQEIFEKEKGKKNETYSKTNSVYSRS